MPTYEYLCTKCERKFELFQSIKDAPRRFIATDCTRCANRAPVKRLIGTGGGLIFKGSGFYLTDYRSENYKTQAKQESEGTPTADGKPAGPDKDAKASPSAPAQPPAPSGDTGKADTKDSTKRSSRSTRKKPK